MPEPFELISQGLNLLTEGQFDQAEQHLLRGIQAYNERKDRDGVGFGLGRLGFFYEQTGQVERARQTYEKAVQYGTDIPATYHNLTTLLAMAGDFDRAFAVAEIWQQRCPDQHTVPPQNAFIQLASSLARADHYDEATRLLTRTLNYFPLKEYPEIYWQIRGLLGHVQEQQGKLDEAMRLYAEAIAQKSTDSLTFTRYLINLEKQKQYELALKVVNQALKIKKDAAWKADLEKRRIRLEQKTGVIPKGTRKIEVPDFSVRGGERNLRLLQQIPFSPQLSNLAVLGDRFFGTSGGKTPKLFCYPIGETDRLWEAPLSADPAGVLACGGRIVAYTRDGRIGDGKTELCFFDLDGHALAQQRLPDVPSEVVATGDRLYAGCRDGKLYAFSVDGRGLWSYKTPGSDAPAEEGYSRPCPYYVDASPELVAFTSYGMLYVLSPNGKLLYTWQMPEEVETSKSEYFTMTVSMGRPSVEAFAIAPSGRNILVASRDEVLLMADGNVLQKAKTKFESVNRVVWIAPDTWGICDAKKFMILEQGKVKGKLPVKGFSQAAFNRVANRLVVWFRNELSVATLSGKLLADVEFVKDVRSVACFDDGRILVGTRYALIFDADPAAPEVVPFDSPLVKPAEAQPEQRPDQENGIPIRWLEAHRLNVGKGKAFYKGADGNELTIEGAVLEQMRAAGYRGQFTENNYWWVIMALLFWDVIFARLPGVYTPQFGDFPGPRQDMPMDFFKPEFYQRRKGLIERRIKDLTTPKLFGLKQPDISAELKTSYERHYGKPCRPIEDWQRFSLPQLLKAVQALSDQQLFKIMLRLLEDFNQNRKGLPDLFLIDPAQKPMFAEVKEEKEKVAEHQIAWLAFLRDQVGVPVEIIRVVEV